MAIDAWWISPTGEAAPETGIHIQGIIRNPAKFGVTREFIKQTYEKHGERFGGEGKAREEIIVWVLKHGFIRIRLYTNKFWSVTLFRFDNHKKEILQEWATEAAKNQNAGKFMNVKILDIQNQKTYNNYSITDLMNYKHFNESTTTTKKKKKLLRFVESVADFPDFVPEQSKLEKLRNMISEVLGKKI